MGKARVSIVILLMTMVFLTGTPVAASGGAAYFQEGLKAEAAFLLDVNTGKALYEKNADKALRPASTTKILTALLLLETAELGEVVEVGKEIRKIGSGSSVAKLKIGDRLTVAELVYALMLPSGNDAAYTAAVFVGRRISGFDHMGVEEAVAVFVARMNSRARELGAENSNFLVPDGYDTPGHVSTAKDLALIAYAARGNSFLRQAVATSEYHWQGIRWGNTNCLVRKECPKAYYPWATGFKTGYTSKAGYCLVATAKGGGRELVGVILKSTQKDRWQDTRHLLEHGFNDWQYYTMFVEGRQVFTVPVSSWKKNQMVKIVAGSSWSDLLLFDQIEELELEFQWQQGIVASGQGGLALKAPLHQGQVVGKAVISCKGEVLGEVKMLAAYGVSAYSWWFLIPGIGLLGLVAAFVAHHRRRHLSEHTKGLL